MNSFTLPIVKAKDLKARLMIHDIRNNIDEYESEVSNMILESIKVVPNPKGTFSHPDKFNH